MKINVPKCVTNQSDEAMLRSQGHVKKCNNISVTLWKLCLC